MRRLFVPLLLLLAFVPSVRADAGDELSVYLMTMGAGDAIFEKFGHNTIRIVDRSTGQDIVHHWGMFDFHERRFFINFALGHLNYSMATEHFADTVAWYRHLNRSMWLQELNLTARQKLELRDFCRWNQREENRYYAYNYFTDNCSTRVRDAIDLVLGGQIKASLDPRSDGTTWRWHTRRLTGDSVLWYTLLNTALGPATDRPISQWEEGFLPVELSRHIQSVTVNGGPLVKSEQVLYESTRPREAQAPPNWVFHYFLAGTAFGGIIASLGHLATRRRGRIAFVIVATAYVAFIGFVGWLGLWGWFFTAHWAAWGNENLFGYSPLALPLAVFIPIMMRERPRPRVRRAAVWLALGVAGSTLIGVLLSPILPQVNREPMALVLPVNFALAWSVWRIVSGSFAKPQAALQAAGQKS